MTRVMRALAGLLLLAAIAACAPPSKFKSYNGPEVTQVVVQKGQRKMYLLHHNKVLKAYDIGLGNEPIGHKMVEGDGRTPEGIFRVDRRNDRSAFHLSLGLDYPRPEDSARARAAGVDPGGDIFIHGQPNGRVERGFRIKGDWTDGCIAVSDDEIAELFAATRIGTEVEIRP